MLSFKKLWYNWYIFTLIYIPSTTKFFERVIALTTSFSLLIHSSIIVKLSDAAIMLLGFMSFKGFIGVENLNMLIKATK